MTPAEHDLLDSPYESTHIAEVRLVEFDGAEEPGDVASVGVFLHLEDTDAPIVTMRAGEVMTPAAARKLAEALLRAADVADSPR